MNKTIINIDSTSLGKSSCMLNFYRTVVGSINSETNQSEGGYREKALSASIVYGIALHKFIDVMYKTKGHIPTARNEANKLFTEIPKVVEDKKLWMGDLKHFQVTCYNVWTEYVEQDTEFQVVEIDGKPATEITFRLKYYEDDLVIIYLCGTIDTIGKITGGCYAIRDWKSTGAWDTASYFSQYQLSRQLRMYTLAFKIMAEREPDSTLGKIGAQTTGAFIDAVFLAPSPAEVKFNRSEVYIYKQKDLDAFRLTLDDTCTRLSSAIRTGYIPKEGIIRGTCEHIFTDNVRFKCSYWNVCKSDEQVSELLLNRDFARVVYNPLKFNEV